VKRFRRFPAAIHRCLAAILNVCGAIHLKIKTAVLGALAVSFVSLTGAEAAECGRASWYALHSMTANGERMNPSAMTAAHKSLPFGTRIKVVNKANGKSVVVRINDRGPFIRGRIVDLSKAAARSIGMIQSGHAKVCYVRI
jgi:rare lipoprotein A